MLKYQTIADELHHAILNGKYLPGSQLPLEKEMCEHLFAMMKKARLSSSHIYLFSAHAFSPEVVQMAKEDSRFELIDMNEL